MAIGKRLFRFNEKTISLLSLLISLVALYFAVFSHYLQYDHARERVAFEFRVAEAAINENLYFCENAGPLCESALRHASERIEELKGALDIERGHLSPEDYGFFGVWLGNFIMRVAVAGLPEPKNAQ